MNRTNMTSHQPAADDNEEVLDAILEQVVLDARAGRRVDVDALVIRHPELASQLRDAVAATLALEISSDQPPPAGAGPTDVAVDRRLGDYRIIREVGRGGMGVVYEAEQLSLARNVALKVLPMAAAMDERALQRFRNEARAAAGLDHPHIVSVYAVGCERATHFLAMRLIDGPPLSELIRVAAARNGTARRDQDADQATFIPSASTRSLDGVPGPTQFSTSDAWQASGYGVGAADSWTDMTAGSKQRHFAAAGLIRQAAEALEYSHSLGVVHRDIKPSNLLLDSRGHLWVADFGLAQLDDGSGLTMTGDLLGTLRYMSPEQATGRRGLVDHRSDLYSLGVTLYELLTLRPAFPQSNRAELLNAVINAEPTGPRKLDRSIPRDLETILLKAIEKDPVRRYQSAGAFAEDLRRFMAGEPVLARRATIADQGTKWVRRHRGLTASSVLIVATVAIASLLSTARIDAAYHEESKHRKLADEAARLEAESYSLAREAIAKMLTHVADEHLSRIPEMAAVRTQVLKEASEFCDKLVQAKPDDPLVYSDRARVRQLQGNYAGEREDRELLAKRWSTVAKYHGHLAKFYSHVPDVTYRDYARAVRNAEMAVAFEPDVAAHHSQLGWALTRVRRFEEAIREHEKAVQLTPQDGDAFAKLSNTHLEAGHVDAAIKAGREAVRVQPGHTYDLAAALSAAGHYDEALAVLDERDQLGAKVLNLSHAWRYELRGNLLMKLRRYEEAIESWQQASELAPFRSYSFKWQSIPKFHLGRFDEALADLRRSLEINPKDMSALTWIDPTLVAQCPNAGFRDGMLALSNEVVGNSGAAPALRARGQLHAAFGNHREAMADFTAAISGGDKAATTHYLAAVVALKVDDQAAYQAACRTMLERFSGSTPTSIAESAAWTAVIGPGAVENYVPVIEMSQRWLAKGPENSDAMLTLGAALFRAGRDGEAAEILRGVESLSKGDAINRAFANAFRGMALLRLNRSEEARELLRRFQNWDPTSNAIETDAGPVVPWNKLILFAELKAEAEAELTVGR